MKSLVLPFFLILIFSCGDQVEEPKEPDNDTQIDSNYCECDQLIFDSAYNHYFLYKKREGFTGYCESFYPSGQLKISKNFNDGKLEGEMLTYFESGKLSERMEFTTNFQTGFQTNFDENGDTLFHALFKRGNLIEIIIQ